MSTLEKILQGLLNCVELTNGDKIQKVSAYDPESLPEYGVLTCVHNSTIEATTQGSGDYYIDVTFHAMTLLAEDPDQKLINALKDDLHRALQKFTPGFLNSSLGLSPAEIVGVLPAEGKSSFESSEEHLFSLGLRLVIINLFF